jgi:putative phosphoribosyl transferase
MLDTMYFANRAEAGRRLAAKLQYLRGRDLAVLGLPRGGVPVALEVAQALGAPLDIIVVRKLGVPFQPELGMGAVGEGGVRILNTEVVRMAGVSPEELAEVEERERAELERRARIYRGDRAPVSLEGRTVVVVDDGIATGSTAEAACRVARDRGAAHVVLAVPVAPPGWDRRLDGDIDDFVCVGTPEPFFGVGQFYADFSQTSDNEVIACLEHGRAPVVRAAASSEADDPPVRDEEVSVLTGSVRLAGHLIVPEEAVGVVVFAHGSGSSRHSSRNRFVASVLNQAKLATLLFDLLSPEEELDRTNVFDVELLADRLGEVTRWVRVQPETRGLPIGYFGASTGAAAALWAAAQQNAEIAAVVSRGGRPDLAGPRLAAVTAPTLLIVGGQDVAVFGLNRQAKEQLHCESRLVLVPGATHLFEEPGTLDLAAELARDWFTDHLGDRTRRKEPPSTGHRLERQ